MKKGARVESLPATEKPCHLGWSRAFDVATQPGLERDSHPGPQHEREQELTCELAVSDPGLSLPIGLERPDVDEDRPPFDELDVVGRAVLDGQTCTKRSLEQFELEEGRVPEHGERPLVRVADEWKTRVFESTGTARRRLDLDGGDDPALGDL